MFRNLDNLFERKRKIINASRNKTGSIKEGLKNFLESKFGEDIKGFSFEISYNEHDNSLVITASNKIIANELTLQLTELYDFLKNENIKLTRILIR